jgi:hypothetical protein
VDKEVKKLLNTAEALQDRLTESSALVNEFAIQSIKLSTEQLLKLKDLSDATDEPSLMVIKSHVELVKSVKDACEVISKASIWVDKAYAISELTEALIAVPVQLELPIEVP